MARTDSVSVEWVVRKLIAGSPVVLASVSGYCLFLVIIPFFLLGVNRVPLMDLVSGKVDYADQMGFLAWIGVSVVMASRYLASLLWLFSAINYASTRRLWVLAVLALAPLPLVYLFAGPYEAHLFDWTGPD